MSNPRNDLDFIRDMLITALNEKRDSIVSDLFALYEKVQTNPKLPVGNINIDKLITDMGNQYNFSLDSDYLDPTTDHVVAAGEVNIPGSSGADVISFGNYKPRDGF